METVNISQDLLQDKVFKAQMQEVVNEIAGKYKALDEELRSTRMVAPGKRIKSAPAFTLYRSGRLNVDWIFAEFPKVINKESKESAGVRDVVKIIVMVAAKRTVLLKRMEATDDPKPQEP